MLERLQAILKRVEQQQATVSARIKEYHDVQTMSYFSDRFGPDHPMSRRAEEGVQLRQQLLKMQNRIEAFCESFEQDFPPSES